MALGVGLWVGRRWLKLLMKFQESGEVASVEHSDWQSLIQHFIKQNQMLGLGGGIALGIRKVRRLAASFPAVGAQVPEYSWGEPRLGSGA